MSDDLGADVDRFVSGLSADDAPRPKRRKATRSVVAEPPEVEEPEEEPEEPEEPEEEPEEEKNHASLLPKELPKPSETRKTLSSVLSKYEIGQNSAFSVQLHRTMPKYFPGGVQAHGYIDEYRQPITEDYIGSEYGGGTYSVRVFGPDPKRPTGTVQFESVTIEISGPPNVDRLARSVRAKLDAAGTPTPSTPQHAAVATESPALAQAALKMVGDVADREREERRRSEDRASVNLTAAKEMYGPIIDAERRRGDEVLRAERERSASEKQHLEDRLKETRDEYRRLEAKVESMANNGSSMSEDLARLLPMIKGDGEAAALAARSSEAITKSILERHQSEVAAVHQQHQSMLDSIRQSHTHEIAAMREANAREVQAEREAGRLREQRHEETLKVEREERRRDMELYKRTADERDQQWRDRMEQNEINLKTMWESRVETQKSNFESQIQWLRSEAEQLQARVRDLQTSAGNQGDIVMQLGRMRELRTGVKDALGIDDSPPPAIQPSGGGIGLSGMGDAAGWQSTIETVVENLAPILQTLGLGQGQGAPPQQQQLAPPQQQQQHRPGDIVQLPQGTMVVVQTPEGLRLTPKDQFDAYQSQQQRTSRQTGPGPKPRGILAAPQQGARPMGGIPVPDMSVGLPKPRPWGEAVQPQMPQDAPPTTSKPVAAAPRQRSPQQQQVPVDDKVKLMIANEVAKLIHHSVENGDEPEEFAQKVMSSGYPDMIVKALAAMSPEEIIAGIKQVQPASAGATPMGQRFVHEALAALRAAL